MTAAVVTLHSRRDLLESREAMQWGLLAPMGWKAKLSLVGHSLGTRGWSRGMEAGMTSGSMNYSD